jgi:hypothetical protein
MCRCSINASSELSADRVLDSAKSLGFVVSLGNLVVAIIQILVQFM